MFTRWKKLCLTNHANVTRGWKLLIIICSIWDQTYMQIDVWTHISLPITVTYSGNNKD